MQTVRRERLADGRSPVAMTPPLVVIADRGVFDSDEAWLSTTVQVAGALLEVGREDLVLQVRVKQPSWRRRCIAAARQALEGPRGSGLAVVLNGATAEALALEFCGVHWPEGQIPDEAPQVPGGFRLSASVHHLAALRKAARAGAHYAIFGPVFDAGSKQAKGVGLEPLRSLATEALPGIVAVGGITPARVGACLQAGAGGVAVVTGIMTAKDPKAAVRRFV